MGRKWSPWGETRLRRIVNVPHGVLAGLQPELSTSRHVKLVMIQHCWIQFKPSNRRASLSSGSPYLPIIFPRAETPECVLKDFCQDSQKPPPW